MARGFEQLSVPAEGTAVTYEDGFTATEAPIVPFSPGVDPTLVTAARRILDGAAEQMGREIHWMRVFTGDAAREQYGTPLPADTIRAFRQFRLGLVGPLAEAPKEAIALENELYRRLGITVGGTRLSDVTGTPSSGRDGPADVTLFRDVSEDVAASLEYEPGTAAAEGLREHLLDNDTGGRLPDEPAGYSVSPISKSATEALVDKAVEYAFEHDRRTITIAHEGDLRPASEGSFRTWARTYLESEYGDGIVQESTFREEYQAFPDDELVLFERRTQTLCRELLADPGRYDTILAPTLGGTYLSTIAGVAAGQPSGSGTVGIGDGTLLASNQSSTRRQAPASVSNPVPLVLAGCLVFDYLGWADAASVVRAAVSATVTDGEWSLAAGRQETETEPGGALAFAEETVDRIEASNPEPGAGGVATTPDERAAIKESIAALYNAVFADPLDPDEIELNQLLHEDEEADVYLPEVGLNFYYWRQWPVERRLEVMLHELAHVEEEPEERDHGDEFYERFLELTAIATDWQRELETAFGEDIDFDRVRWFIVDSVHEETIEEDSDSVEERKRWLRNRLSLGDDYDVE